MIQVDFYQAKEQFLEIIERVLSVEEIVIERDEQPLVKVTAVGVVRKPRVFGSARGMIQIADDFDEPLEDFQEYM